MSMPLGMRLWNNGKMVYPLSFITNLKMKSKGTIYTRYEGTDITIKDSNYMTVAPFMAVNGYIYENDIVTNGDATGIVKFDLRHGMFMLYFDEAGDMSVPMEDVGIIKILGNTFENPELLSLLKAPDGTVKSENTADVLTSDESEEEPLTEDLSELEEKSYVADAGFEPADEPAEQIVSKEPVENIETSVINETTELHESVQAATDAVSDVVSEPSEQDPESEEHSYQESSELYEESEEPIVSDEPVISEPYLDMEDDEPVIPDEPQLEATEYNDDIEELNTPKEIESCRLNEEITDEEEPNIDAAPLPEDPAFESVHELMPDISEPQEIFEEVLEDADEEPVLSEDILDVSEVASMIGMGFSENESESTGSDNEDSDEDTNINVSSVKNNKPAIQDANELLSMVNSAFGKDSSDYMSLKNSTFEKIKEEERATAEKKVHIDIYLGICAKKGENKASYAYSVFVNHTKTKDFVKAVSNTDFIKAPVTAVKELLLHLSEKGSITLHCNSSVVYKPFASKIIDKWRANNWKKDDGKVLNHSSEWNALYNLIKEKNVEWDCQESPEDNSELAEQIRIAVAKF